MKVVLYILIGAILASGAWYLYDIRNPEDRLRRTEAQLYRDKLKEAAQELQKGNTDIALRNAAVANLAHNSVEEKIQHPLSAICGSTHPNLGDSKLRLHFDGICNPPQGAWIYDGDAPLVADVRIKTDKGVTLDITPDFQPKRGSSVQHLGGYRYRFQGTVDFFLHDKVADGVIVELTPIQ